jgi:hypothetical protein
LIHALKVFLILAHIVDSGVRHLPLWNIGWFLCSICSEKRKERRRNNHCKCDLATIGVDHCPGSAAYLALSTETISDEGRRAWDI